MDLFIRIKDYNWFMLMKSQNPRCMPGVVKTLLFFFCKVNEFGINKSGFGIKHYRFNAPIFTPDLSLSINSHLSSSQVRPVLNPSIAHTDSNRLQGTLHVLFCSK
jgi:hypothetical protein